MSVQARAGRHRPQPQPLEALPRPHPRILEYHVQEVRAGRLHHVAMRQQARLRASATSSSSAAALQQRCAEGQLVVDHSSRKQPALPSG